MTTPLKLLAVAGTGFSAFNAGAVDSFTIDGNAVSNLTVVSDTEITCDTPSSTAGTVDVVLTIGSESVTLAGAFEYQASSGLPVTDGLIFRASAPGLTGYSDGDPISNVPDESGNGNDADNSDVMYASSAVNGHPAIHMGFANLKILKFSTPLTFSGAVSEVLVWRPVGMTGPNPGGWRSGNTFFIYRKSNKLPWIRWAGSEVLKPGSGYSTDLNQNACTVFQCSDSGVAEMWEGGSLRHSSSHSRTLGTISIDEVGHQKSGEYIDCYVVERLFYNRILTPQEISDITDWANTTYLT